MSDFTGKALIPLFTATVPNIGYPFTIDFTFRPETPEGSVASAVVSSKEELEAAFFVWLEQPEVKLALANLRLTEA
jgi:hypothetical protein